MPRANRRRKDDSPLDAARLGGVTSTQRYAGGYWTVRQVTGASATRPYLCPGCQQDVPVGVPHVVAWPADGVGGVGDRRHWHSGCWQRRDARPSGNAYR
ncbi:hypothetical protein V3N99_04115 [Dermatophilaceae bacterium Soc4.6]